MFKHFPPTALLFLMSGAFFGWFVASGKVSTIFFSNASPIDTVISPGASCCSDNLTKEKMLALAVTPQPQGDTAKPKENKKPNILVIWGDDIGTWNISHNNRGMMGPEKFPSSKTIIRIPIGINFDSRESFDLNFPRNIKAPYKT